MDNKKKEIDAYKTIGEVAEELALPQHVIRFWETKFSVLRPKKVNTRRYFSKQQFQTLITIKNLLYVQGFTIAGAISFIKQQKSDLLSSAVVNKKNNDINNSATNFHLHEIKNKLQNLQTRLLSLAN